MHPISQLLDGERTQRYQYQQQPCGTSYPNPEGRHDS